MEARWSLGTWHLTGGSQEVPQHPMCQHQTMNKGSCVFDRNLHVMGEYKYGRHALVIGNSQYDSSKLYNGVRFGNLEGPYYDARHMAEKLESRAFKVTRCFNKGAQGLHRELDKFRDNLRARHEGGEGRDEVRCFIPDLFS